MWVTVSAGIVASAHGQDTETEPAAAEGSRSDNDVARRDEEAQLHFRAGRARYDEGRFREAAREFEAALELSARPVLYYNIFLAYRDDGDFRAAIEALSAYLEQVPEIDDRERLEARLENMQRVLARQEAQAEEARRAEEAAREAEQEAAAAERLAEAATERAEAAEERATWIPGWAIFGVGAAAAIAGAVTGGMALQTEADLEGRCVEGPDGWTCPPGAQADADRGATLAMATDGLLIGGAAVAVTGLVLALVIDGAPDDSTEDASPTVSVACDPSGCIATLGGQF